jgi:hypothetical protein
MCDFWAAGRARDHIVLSDGVALVTEPQFTLALEDQEHFLLAMVAMERALDLAGRHNRKVVAQLFRSDVIADLAATGSVETVLFYIVELDIIQVHDGLHYGVLKTTPIQTLAASCRHS